MSGQYLAKIEVEHHMTETMTFVFVVEVTAILCLFLSRHFLSSMFIDFNVPAKRIGQYACAIDTRTQGESLHFVVLTV